MKWFKKALMNVCDEIDGSENYIKTALAMQSTDEDIADMYCKMAEQEMNHAMNNKDIAEKLMEKAKREENPDYETMRTIYDFEADKNLDWIKQVKLLIAMYKE